MVDGLRLELKTRLGSKNARTVERADSLSVGDLYQLLGYLYLTARMSSAIDYVGFYSGRYGP